LKSFEEFKSLELEPNERVWEYDGDGQRIYKLECGFSSKTVYDGGHALWKLKYGYEWEEE
jgi:hypothetical protein